MEAAKAMSTSRVLGALAIVGVALGVVLLFRPSSTEVAQPLPGNGEDHGDGLHSGPGVVRIPGEELAEQVGLRVEVEQALSVEGVNPAGFEDRARPDLRVSAVCVDEAGVPLSGVAMSALGRESEPPAVSDGQGRVSLSWNPRAGRVGAASSASPRISPSAFQFAFPGRITRVIYDAAYEDHGNLDCGVVVLGPDAGSARGRVVEAGGQPLAGIDVYAAFPVPEVDDETLMMLKLSGLGLFTAQIGGTTTRTDYDGWFELANLPAQAICIWAQATDSYAAWTSPFTLGGGFSHDVGTIVLEKLGSEMWIDGHVLNPDGSPSPQAMVVCQSQTEAALGPPIFRCADATGYFRVPALQGVLHRLRAQCWEDMRLAADVESIKGGAAGIVLRLTSSGPESVSTAAIAGVVIREGVPESEALVEAYAYDIDALEWVLRQRLRSDSDGRFRMGVSSESMLVLGRSSDGGWVGVGERPYEPGASDPDLLVLELHRASTIQGRVVVARAQKAGGIELLATSEVGLPMSALTGDDGEFRFRGLQAGAWMVEIKTRLNWAFADKVQQSLVLGNGETASVELDGRAQALLTGKLAIGSQEYAGWEWSLGEGQGSVQADGSFTVFSSTIGLSATLTLGAAMDGWTVQVTSSVELTGIGDSWSFEADAGLVELVGLPLEAAFSDGGQFVPVCYLRYVSESGAVWEAMPITAVKGRRLISFVPTGNISIMRYGGALSGEIVEEISVQQGKTTTVAWDG